MPTEILPKNATLLQMIGNPVHREEYVRSVVENFHKLGPQHADFVVRIGVQGRGLAPNYRFEAITPVICDGQPAGTTQDTFIIYSGASHEKITQFEIEDAKDENWSSETMTFAEVQKHLGDLRARPRRI